RSCFVLYQSDYETRMRRRIQPCKYCTKANLSDDAQDLKRHLGDCSRVAAGCRLCPESLFQFACRSQLLLPCAAQAVRWSLSAAVDSAAHPTWKRPDLLKMSPNRTCVEKSSHPGLPKRV